MHLVGEATRRSITEQPGRHLLTLQPCSPHSALKSFSSQVNIQGCFSPATEANRNLFLLLSFPLSLSLSFLMYLFLSFFLCIYGRLTEPDLLLKKNTTDYANRGRVTKKAAPPPSELCPCMQSQDSWLKPFD